MYTQISKTSNSSDENFIDPEKLLQEGLNNIFKTFKSKNNEYLFQINEQNKLIIELRTQLEKVIQQLKSLQKEIEYYKSKNDQLLVENESLNKMVNNIKGRLTNKFNFKINNKEIATIIDDKSTPSEKINLKSNGSISFLKNSGICGRNNYYFKKKNATDIKNINSYNKIDNKYKIVNTNDNLLNEKIDFNRDLETNRCKSNNNHFSKDENTKNFSTKNMNRKYNTIEREINLKDENKDDKIRKRRVSCNNDFFEENQNKKLDKNNERFKSTPFLFSKSWYEEIKLDNKNGDYINELKSQYNELKNKEITFFLHKCKIVLDKKIFEKIINIFQEYKDGLITNEGIVKKTRKYIKNNEDLLKLFNNIIS